MPEEEAKPDDETRTLRAERAHFDYRPRVGLVGNFQTNTGNHLALPIYRSLSTVKAPPLQRPPPAHFIHPTPM